MRAAALTLAGLAVALRLVLVFLPGLGRDESVYLYWTWHPQPDYAPLLQGQLFFLRLLHDAPWFLRLGQFATGLVALGLFHRWARPGPAGLAAIAATPWLVFSGAILHPDALFVAGLLAMACGFREEKTAWVAAGALVALGAKITGLIAVAVAMGWLARRRRWGGFAAVSVGVFVFLLFLEPRTLEAARGFARIDAGLLPRLALLAVEALFLGAALVVATRPPRDAAGGAGLAIVLLFLFAAVAGGQVKANWLLPGLLLLYRPGTRRDLALAGIGIVLSGAMVLGFQRPGVVRPVESRLAWLAYPRMAGERERAVSSAVSWEEHLLNWQVRMQWPQMPETPTHIVSDDYGIAARLALACPELVPEIVVPAEPLYEREPGTIVGRPLVVAVRTAPERLGTGRVLWRGSIPHPVNGRPIALALMEGFR